MEKPSFWQRKSRCFTFPEILIVLIFIAVLAGLFILLVRPQDIFKRARDLRRLSDLNDIDAAIHAALLENPSLQLGETNTLYLSLPDTSATCSSWISQLPVLQAGWQYRCVPEANLTKINASGWVPVDLTGIKHKGFLSLPIDPSNRPPYYYSYVRGSTHLTALLEYLQEPAKTDGGSSVCLYETGSQLTLTPSWFLQGRVEGCEVEEEVFLRRPPFEINCPLPGGCAVQPGPEEGFKEGSTSPSGEATTSSPQEECVVPPAPPGKFECPFPY